MPKWVHTPRPTDKPIRFQYHQDAFWKAIKERYCKTCHKDFLSTDVIPTAVCPSCSSPGIRKWHRLCIIAGRRFGKSMAGSIAAVQEAMIPNTIGWACAPTNPKLHRYVIPAFQQLIPPDMVSDWSSEFSDLRLKNGSLIHFQTLEDPDQGRGQGLDWLWIDEICELTEQHWHVIRPSLTEKRGVAFFTTSPRSYDWVYDSFYSKAEQQIPGYWAAHCLTSDNPTISPEEIAEARATMPDAMFRQEYLADFVNFTGAVYGETFKDSHILRTNDQIQAFIPEWPDINSSRQVLVGVDTGADHPFGAVKLVSTEKGMIVVGEYLERNKSFVEHANAMKRLANSASAKWAINKNEKQPMIELAQHGIMCMPAQNDQVAGIERVKSWFHADQLFIVDSACPKTIKQMKAYRWAENVSPKDGSARKEKVYKREDELPDCIRYALMTWPMLPKHVDPVVVHDISKLPEASQRLILRERRIAALQAEQTENDYTPLETNSFGDFWL